MSISAGTSRALHQTLGEEAGDEVVNWMQRMEFNRVESREMLEVSLSRFDDRMELSLSRFDAKMDARLAEFQRVMDARLAEFQRVLDGQLAEFRREMTEFRAEIRADVSRLEVKMEQRHAELMRWSLVYWVGAVASIAALAKILR